MKTLIDIEIDEDYHISKTADCNKVSIYIPEKELCLPKEEHYYGLKEFNQVSNFIDDETYYITARNFIRDAKTSNICFEIACSPENLLSNGTYLGYSILHFVKENCLSLNHLDFYHVAAKTRKTQYRFNNILKRLYSGLRTTEMTSEEWEIYNSPTKILQQKNIELDIEVQELRNDFLKNEHSYYIDDKAIDEFLISIHRNYFGEA
jgi:hypothetical protein